MTKWWFRLRGQYSKADAFPHFDYFATDVTSSTVDGRPVVELRMAGQSQPVATFEIEAIFGYLKAGGSTIRVWCRDATSSGECMHSDFVANFVERGKLGEIDTWDAWQNIGDHDGPLGRMVARWVSEVRREQPSA